MAAAKEHPFFGKIIESLLEVNNRAIHSYNHILETTGPFMLSRVYENYVYKEQIAIHNSALLYPLTKNEITETISNTHLEDEIKKRLQAAYAIHYY
jgi:inositol phosphorylceramide mannosyltransferase catalytic subunit